MTGQVLLTVVACLVLVGAVAVAIRLVLTNRWPWQDDDRV